MACRVLWPNNKKDMPMIRTAYASARWKLASTLLLVALGDFLLFDTHVGALSLAIYSLVLLFAITWHNMPRLDNNPAIVATALLAGQTMALILGYSTLPYWWLLFGFGALCAMTSGIYKAQALQWAWLFLRMGLYALYLPLKNFEQWQHARARHNGKTDYALLLRNWLLPVVAGMVFLGLFSGANPVFYHLTAWLNLDFLGDIFDNEARPFFWILLCMVVWMLLRPRLPQWMRPKPRNALLANNSALAWLFEPSAILRALLLCNAIFAVQTFSDVAYLWGGAELPKGISYARYAQNGAYSLLCAALLAAGFVLVALREGSEAAKRPLVRWLTYGWIGQNLLLLLAAAQRLSLYVETYSLTYLRLAAFVWMALVAMGLVLIICRIVYGKSGKWLVRANVTALLAVLYVSSFANIGGFIANYNVSHSMEMGGKRPLDLWHLQREVGTASLPALRRYTKQGQLIDEQRKRTQALILRYEHETTSAQRHWRSWTLRNYWLALENASGYGSNQQPRERR